MTPYDPDDSAPRPSAPDLVAFLLARLAEDEGEARSLAEDYPSFTDDMGWHRNGDDVKVALGVGRALAEVEAKRRIVDQWYLPDQPLGDDAYQIASEDAVRILAAVLQRPRGVPRGVARMTVIQLHPRRDPAEVVAWWAAQAKTPRPDLAATVHRIRLRKVA